MNRLKALRANRASLVREANAATEAALARATEAGGGLTDEETQAEERYNARIAEVDALIQAEERRLERERSLTPPHPDAGPIADEPEIDVEPPNVATDPFRGFRLGGGEEAFDMAAFALAVRHACRPGGAIDSRLVEGGLMAPGGLRAAPTNVHQETGQAEGAMVPPVVSREIWQLVFDDPILGRLDIEPTASNVVELTADESTPWGSSGIQAKWRSEGSQMTASKLTTDPRQVRLQELYAFASVSEEILQDAPRLANRLNAKAPEAIRWKLVEGFVYGTGAGQPLGWAADNYAGKVAVARTTASQVKPDDLVKMYARSLMTGGPDRRFWAANPAVFSELVLRSTVGNIPVWMPNQSLSGSPHGTILGLPLVFSEHAAALGSAGDIQLVDPAGYYATQRGPMRQDTSIHLYFDYGVTAFRWMVRFGGMPLLETAVSPAKGSATKSYFVILAA